jgi:hypothetical protein
MGAPGDAGRHGHGHGKAQRLGRRHGSHHAARLMAGMPRRGRVEQRAKLHRSVVAGQSLCKRTRRPSAPRGPLGCGTPECPFPGYSAVPRIAIATRLTWWHARRVAATPLQRQGVAIPAAVCHESVLFGAAAADGHRKPTDGAGWNGYTDRPLGFLPLTWHSGCLLAVFVSRDRTRIRAGSWMPRVLVMRSLAASDWPSMR